MKRFFLVTGAVLLLGASCGGPGSYTLASREAELHRRVEQYHDRFQWRDYETASLFVLPRMRGDFLSFTERLKRGYIVEGFTIKNIQLSASGEQAAVSVKRSFINPPSITLQTENLAQQWVYQDGGWFLAGPPY